MSSHRTLVNLRHAKVLVVEDNAQALDILSQVLVGFGVSEFRKCETAEDAHRVIAKTVFDVILVDGEMQDENGFDFTRRVRGDPGGGNFTTPTIIITGCPTRAKIVEARDCGANFVVAKPIVPRTLLDRIVWIARNTREFVDSDTYRGPDRRFHNVALPHGVPEDRRADSQRLVATPQRELSQSEIDSLF